MGSLKTDGAGWTRPGTGPRRSPWRWPLAVAAVVAAAAHLPVISPHLREAPYMGVLFVLLTAACLLLAVAVLTFDSPAVYLAAATVCGLAVVGYAATRLVAFPQLADDVDNWFEPLGVLAVLGEMSVVTVAAFALRSRRWGEGPRGGVTRSRDSGRVGSQTSRSRREYGGDRPGEAARCDR